MLDVIAICNLNRWRTYYSIPQSILDPDNGVIGCGYVLTEYAKRTFVWGHGGNHVGPKLLV